jgi:ubiquinone/menaquinone biosynthesis C-methylase UbiE
MARARIGIDVLADSYSQFGIHNHNMIYVASDERRIPLPSNYVDVMFTMNAMDYVSNFSVMAAEIVRVIAPGDCSSAHSISATLKPLFGAADAYRRSRSQRILTALHD